MKRKLIMIVVLIAIIAGYGWFFYRVYDDMKEGGILAVQTAQQEVVNQQSISGQN